VLYLDPQRGIVAINGPIVEQVVNDFEMLERRLQETLAVNLVEAAQFYEFILDGEAKVEPPRNPSQEIANLWRNAPALSELSHILGWRVTQFGLRLVLEGTLTTEPKWSDFRIDPSVARPQSHYMINVVYREPQKEGVIAEAGRVVERVNAILNFLAEAS
jgi:hypothetical protein